MEGSPLILISHDLIRLLSSRTCLLTTQVPSYSLLPCVVLLFTHILVMLSLSSLLLRKRVSSVWKKKNEDAGYLSITRGCLQGQKISKGILHVSYVASYGLRL